HLPGEPGGLGAEPVVQRQLQRTIRRWHGDTHSLIRNHGAVIAEPRDVLRIGGVGEGERRGELVAGVEGLRRGAGGSVVQEARDVGLELASPDAGEPRIANAVIVAIEAACAEAPIVAEWAVDVEVVPAEPLGGSGGAHRAREYVAPRLVDEVDDRAR